MLKQFPTQLGRRLQQLEEWLLSAAILVIAALTILNVICRSIFGFSLAFTGEVSQFCMIVVCFVGLSYAASKGRHIRMTALYDQLGSRVCKVFMIMISASTAGIMFLLSWYAFSYVQTVYELGGIYPALRIPFYVVYAIAPIGLFSAGVQYALATIKNLTHPQIYVSFERTDDYEDPVTQEI